MILRHANSIGSVAVVGALALLLISLVLRTAGIASFLAVAACVALPYLIMLFVHHRFKPTGWTAVASLVASLFVAGVGVWLTLDALFISFGPESAGLAMLILLAYQMPPAIVALLVCLLARRIAERDQQPPNQSLNTNAERAAAESGR